MVYVRPELVVEVAFDGLQRSSRYPGGLALRFARIKGYRTDKSAVEADTMGTRMRNDFLLTKDASGWAVKREGAWRSVQ